MTGLRIARVLHSTTVEGPGVRSAVWTQGCSIRCTGCINPHLFTADGGESVDVYALAQDVMNAGDEGITLLGGEPFDQADACSDLAGALRKRDSASLLLLGIPMKTLSPHPAPRGYLLIPIFSWIGPDRPIIPRRSGLSWARQISGSFTSPSDIAIPMQRLPIELNFGPD